MKKSLLLFLLSGFVYTSFAQSVHLGIRAGLNEATLSEKFNFPNFDVNSLKSSSKHISRFHAGLFAEITKGSFSIQPGVIYTQKGGEVNYAATFNNSNILSYNSNQKVTLNYLEIPINILYNIPVGVGKIFIGGGPYAAFGLSGHSQTFFVLTPQPGAGAVQYGKIEEKVKFGKNDYKDPDYGINTLIGLRLKNKISFNIGYGFGLTNLYHSDFSVKNNVLSIAVGYEFL